MRDTPIAQPSKPSDDSQKEPQDGQEMPCLLSLPEDPDTLIRAAHAPEYVGIARQTMSRWRHEGRPPRYCRLGRRIFYRAGDLREWFDSEIRNSTSEDSTGPRLRRPRS